MEVSSNGEKSYVANQLSTDLAWNDVMMDIAGSYPNHQQVKMPKYKVSGKLELLHRSGKRTYTFNTYNAYMVNPHSLTVDNSQQTAYQSVRSAAFFSHTNTSLGFFLKPFTVMMKVGLQVLNRTMKSHLEGVPDSLGNMCNQLGMTFFRAYASPEAEYNQGGWHIRFQMPITFTPYYYRDVL